MPTASRPFDDQAACIDFLGWMAHHAERESPHFAANWAAARKEAHKDCYSGFLTIPGLELARRGQPAPPLDQAIVTGVIEACRGLIHKNWTLPIPIWWLKRYADAFTAEQRAQLREICIATKFWMSDPGQDDDCYFTENHQIIFHVDEFLIGGMWPEEVFPVSGQTGAWHRARARVAIVRWMGWRARFGFSEHKSYGYSDAILFILLTLREFCDDVELQVQADGILDTVLLAYALNNFRGDLCACQGRSDFPNIVRGEEWLPAASMSLLWGQGRHDLRTSAAAILLACSGYRVPAAIQAIARDRSELQEHRERQSLDPEEGAGVGVDPASDEQAMFYWGSQQFSHPLTIAATQRAMPWSGYYMNQRVVAWAEQHRLCTQAGLPLSPDTDHTAIGRAEDYGCRTPDWKLSCLLDFRPGQRGFQQQVWLAGLGGRALVFSQQPGNGVLKESGGFWKGNGILPRAAAYRNVCICVHRIRPDQTLWLMTHAYFPKWVFDEVVEDAGWVCARRGQGFVALRSLNPATWSRPDPQVLEMIHPFDPAAKERGLASHYEWAAGGHANAFICELGRESVDGPFAGFVRRIVASKVEGDWQHLRYASPSLGEVGFGWTGAFTVAGREIPLRQDQRLASPYCSSQFGDPRLDIRAGGHRLELDVTAGLRRETRS
jgi:hypothetical protein